MKYTDLDMLVNRWITLADADGANQKADASHANRNAWINVTADGFHGSIQGCAVVGVGLKEILDRFTQAEWDKDWEATKARYGADAVPALMPRTDTQRRADALCAIFEAAIATPADARPPEPVVNLLADPVTFCKVLAVFFGIQVTPDQEAAADALVPFEQRRCESSTGVAVSPNEMFVAALAGWIRRVVVDSRSVVIDMGRTQRLYKGDARIAALMGWIRCFWPGCEVPAARCQTDHLTEWQHLGTTSPDDGAPACNHHNLFKHNRGYTVTRDEHGRLHTHRPNGTEVA